MTRGKNKSMDAWCRVEVNNLPPHTYKYIVTKRDYGTSKLRYISSYADGSQAREIAKLVDGIIVRRTDDE